jgi:hypothetical protein
MGIVTRKTTCPAATCGRLCLSTAYAIIQSRQRNWLVKTRDQLSMRAFMPNGNSIALPSEQLVSVKLDMGWKDEWMNGPYTSLPSLAHHHVALSFKSPSKTM